MNKIYYLNEDGNEDMKRTLNGSVQGKVHTFNKAQIEYLMMYYRRFVCQINLQSDLFANVQFPSLPDNFQMLMGEMDFPEKAKVNINNSLFMNPQQIDQSSAEDIGLQQFNSSKFKNLTGMKMTLAPQAYSRQMESIVYAFDKIALSQLFEDTASGTGVSIDPKDVKAHNTAMAQLNTTVIDAINNYIEKSKDAVKSLLEMVAGGGSAKEALKSIQTASEASDKTVGDWLDSVSAIRKESSESMRMGQLSSLKNMVKYTKAAFNFLACVNKSNIPGKMSKNEYYNIVSDDAYNIQDKTDMDKMIARFTTFKKYDDFLNYYKQKLGNKPGPIPLKPQGENDTNTSESYHFSTIKDFKALNESGYDEFENNETGLSEDKPLDYDKIYQDLFHYLARAMSNAIGERDNWLCFKDVRQNMDTLVKGADEEITKKIEIVCKTGGQKSLVHWPFKAEGLKGMWKRYMSELQLRINNRIDQLTGSHGSVTTGSANMVEQFLTVTYPQIIAMMVTYKCVFQQLKEMYSRDLMVHYTFEDCEDIIQESEDQFADWVRIF